MPITKMFLFKRILLVKVFLIFTVETKRTHQTTLAEYRKVMPPAVFNRFKPIYSDKSLTTTKRLELLDELFKALPDELLKRLPVPAPFLKLPPAQQKYAHRIYYSKKIGLEEKMRKLERMINQVSSSTDQQQQRLMPIHPLPVEAALPVPAKHMPTLVKFDVPVLLQFSGHLETHLLKAYLEPNDYEFLEWIIAKKGTDEMSRARLIGVLLKQAYQLDPDNFPLPLNGDSHEIDDNIRNLGVRLMFGRSTFDRVDPVKAKLAALKRLFAQSVREDSAPKGKSTNEPAFDSAEGKNAWADRLEMLPEAKVFDFRQNDGKGSTVYTLDPSMFGNLNKFLAAFNGTMHWDWHGDDLGPNITKN